MNEQTRENILIEAINAQDNKKYEDSIMLYNRIKPLSFEETQMYNSIKKKGNNAPKIFNFILFCHALFLMITVPSLAMDYSLTLKIILPHLIIISVLFGANSIQIWVNRNTIKNLIYISINVIMFTLFAFSGYNIAIISLGSIILMVIQIIVKLIIKIHKANYIIDKCSE
jgi:hypothetical protein